MFDEDYNRLLDIMHHHTAQLAREGRVLVVTDLNPQHLWEQYLAGFKEAGVRQYHTCSTCHAFFMQYADLGVFTPDGSIVSAMFPEVEAGSKNHYAPAIRRIHKAFKQAQFLRYAGKNDLMWGTPAAGHWAHFHVSPPREWRQSSQDAARKLHNLENVRLAQQHIPQAVLRRAIAILDQDIYRADNVLPGAKWFESLFGKRNHEVIEAVAKAPDGFCHPRSGMIGTLIDDLQAGYSDADAAKRFEAKMHPLSYRRTVAPAKSGTIDRAEKLFDSLGLAPALDRRTLDLADLDSIPGARHRRTSKTFASLRRAAAKVGTVKRMSWKKFSETVLPGTKDLKVKVTDESRFCTLLTAVNASTPCLFKWGHHASWFFYHGGSYARQYSLTNGLHNVLLVTDPFDRDGALLIVEGARDANQTIPMPLFPECLRSDLHEVRAVVEQYAATRTAAVSMHPVAGILQLAARWKPLTLVADGQEYELAVAE